MATFLKIENLIPFLKESYYMFVFMNVVESFNVHFLIKISKYVLQRTKFFLRKGFHNDDGHR